MWKKSNITQRSNIIIISTGHLIMYHILICFRYVWIYPHPKETANILRKNTAFMCVCVCVYVCAMQETQELWVGSLGQEDSLKEENGNPLQYFCMKNPMDMLGN